MPARHAANKIKKSSDVKAGLNSGMRDSRVPRAVDLVEDCQIRIRGAVCAHRQISLAAGEIQNFDAGEKLDLQIGMRELMFLIGLIR
jgi:hypothetical protein